MVLCCVTCTRQTSTWTGALELPIINTIFFFVYFLRSPQKGQKDFTVVIFLTY